MVVLNSIIRHFFLRNNFGYTMYGVRFRTYPCDYYIGSRRHSRASNDLAIPDSQSRLTFLTMDNLATSDTSVEPVLPVVDRLNAGLISADDNSSTEDETQLTIPNLPYSIQDEINAQVSHNLTVDAQMEAVIAHKTFLAEKKPIVEPVVYHYYPHGGCHEIIDKVVRATAKHEGAEILTLDALELSSADIYGDQFREALSALYRHPIIPDDTVERFSDGVESEDLIQPAILILGYSNIANQISESVSVRGGETLRKALPSIDAKFLQEGLTSITLSPIASRFFLGSLVAEGENEVNHSRDSDEHRHAFTFKFVFPAWPDNTPTSTSVNASVPPRNAFSCVVFNGPTFSLDSFDLSSASLATSISFKDPEKKTFTALEKSL
ncbi:hypothetical protein BDQ17DRAFT_202631 [Cyathus striatus]|nr:hypothetical protein BDQ17DRAFT_202631 [Cyathus striatus]